MMENLLTMENKNEMKRRKPLYLPTTFSGGGPVFNLYSCDIGMGLQWVPMHP